MIPMYNQIHRKTKETEVNLEFEQVAPENGEGNAPKNNVRYVLNLQVKGDFAHHTIEDAMIALNELAEIKGIGHKLI